LNRLSVMEVHHHTFAYGHTHALAEYLRERASSFIFIQHPFAHKRFHSSTVELYISGKLVRRVVAPSMRAPETILFVKDLFLTIIFALRMKRRVQLFIGTDALNALSGLFLRMLRFTRFLILFVIDYTPRRFPNKTVNLLYHALNLVVARRCDLLWVVSERIKQTHLQVYGTRCPILVVQGGTNKPQAISDTRTAHNRLVFLGNLDESKGLQLAIQALPRIKERIPEVKLIVIGDGPYYSSLVKLVRELRIEHSVEFVGHMPDHQKVMQILAQCDVGLAPYIPDVKNISMYGFPLKTVEYLAAGLPVIMTNVSEMAHKLSAMNAGILIDYKVEDMVNAVIHLLTDKSRLQSYKENAIRLGREYSWDRIFNQVLTKTIKILIHRKKVDASKA